jgi:hypothetical protein
MAGIDASPKQIPGRRKSMKNAKNSSSKPKTGHKLAKKFCKTPKHFNKRQNILKTGKSGQNPDPRFLCHSLHDCSPIRETPNARDIQEFISSCHELTRKFHSWF